MKVLAYTILILFLLGLVGKVAEHDAAIKELRDTPVTVATVDLTRQTVLKISILEQEVDMLKLCVEDLMSITNIDKSVDLLSWKVNQLEVNTPAMQYKLVDGKVIPQEYTLLSDDVEKLQQRVGKLEDSVTNNVTVVE